MGILGRAVGKGLKVTELDEKDGVKKIKIIKNNKIKNKQVEEWRAYSVHEPEPW